MAFKIKTATFRPIRTGRKIRLGVRLSDKNLERRRRQRKIGIGTRLRPRIIIRPSPMINSNSAHCRRRSVLAVRPRNVKKCDFNIISVLCLRLFLSESIRLLICINFFRILSFSRFF